MQEQRLAVVAEALTWIGTPFAHAAAVKGEGCDCSHLGMAFTSAIGIPIHWPADPKKYTANPRWFTNEDPETGEFHEIYLEGLLENGFIEISDGRDNFEAFRPVADKPTVLGPEYYAPGARWINAKKDTGDIVVARLGRIFAHGAIIQKWPWVIQAESYVGGRGKVARATADCNYFLSQRKLRFFSWKGWH